MSIVIDYTKGFFEAAPSGETVGDIAGSATLDLATGNVFSYTPAADTTFVFSNPPATGSAYGMTLKVTGADVAAGYDLANAVYDTVSFSVAAQEGVPNGIFFKPDGLKMYVIGSTEDKIFQYSLSTAWDVSTSSFVQSFSVAPQDNNPQGVFFKPDGTKMYVIGFSYNVYQYSLSTAWDVSSTSYDNLFGVTETQFYPSDVFFKPDGTKFYVIGFGNDAVDQYSLSTAWDISTTTNDSISFSVSTEDSTPRSVYFNPEGTKCYVLGQTTDAVYEYTLSTAWDLTTASYSGFSFTVASQDADATGIAFKPDGTKMYICGEVSDTVYQYSTSGAAPATFTYPASVDWPSATAPTAPATGETDVYTFYTTDGGTTYYGFQVGDAMA
jgi:DNA-binding beta-propeller fold protein YncE